MRGAEFCTQDKCKELKRDFLCDNKQCIDGSYQCDGDYSDCGDGSDEGAELCTQVKCKELKRDFLCDNNKCLDGGAFSAMGLI